MRLSIFKRNLLKYLLYRIPTISKSTIIFHNSYKTFMIYSVNLCKLRTVRMYRPEYI